MEQLKQRDKPPKTKRKFCPNRIPFTGYGTVEQREKPPRNESFTQRCATVLSAASTTITYWNNLNTCSRTAKEFTRLSYTEFYLKKIKKRLLLFSMPSSPDEIAQSWYGSKQISKPVPPSDWTVAIKRVLNQVHPSRNLDGDSLLVMIDFVDLSLHRIATKADSLLSHESQRKLSDVCLTPPYTNVQQQDRWLVDEQREPNPWWLVNTHTKLIGYQILAERLARAGHDEFLVTFEGYEDQTPTWETREDVERVGLNLGAFEAKSAADRTAAYRNFEEVYKSKTGEPFAPNVLTGRHIHAAVNAILPCELGKHAESELTNALTKYSGSEDGASRAGRQIGNVSCRRARAGLQFPVDIVGGMLDSFCGRIVCESAPVALAAVMEYLVAEVLELAGNSAGDHGKNGINPRDIHLAVVYDEELDIWMQGSLIMCGGANFYHTNISKPVRLKKYIDVKERMGFNDEYEQIEYVTAVELGDHAPVVTPVASWSMEQLKKGHIVTFCAPPSPDPPPPPGPSPLHAFLCPISHDIMRDPVITTADGMTYERCEIVEWLKKSNMSPMTGDVLPTLDLKPNVALRNAIDEWISLENEKAQKVTDEPCEAGESAGIVGDCMQGLVNSDSGEKKNRPSCFVLDNCPTLLLDNNGWRRLLARAGVRAYSTRVFNKLRWIALGVLEELLYDCDTVGCALSASLVITTDLLLTALVSRSSTGSRRFGREHVTLGTKSWPLGSGYLCQALMMSWCEKEKKGLKRVFNGIKEIEWDKVAQAERANADYADVIDEEQEKQDQEEDEEEASILREAECLDRAFGLTDFYQSGDEMETDFYQSGDEMEEACEGEEEEAAVVAAVVEYLVAEVTALRMIRTEKRSAKPVFALSVFSSVLCQIGREQCNKSILWEANALVILNCKTR
jgi:histone H2A